MSSSQQPATNSFLIWGSRGWIGQHVFSYLQSQGKDAHLTSVRLEDRAGIIAEIERIKPTHVINCAGVIGRPNADWCEDNKEETVRSNVIGALMLVDVCKQRNVHCTFMSTGCLYKYTDEHPMGGKPYKETDPANFGDSIYCYTKSRVEEIIVAAYPDTLTLRLRMPVSDDLSPRSVVTKLTKYNHIVSVPNSFSILTDLMPAAIALAEHHEKGVYNFTNPGAITHNEIMELFKEVVRPTLTWKNFTVEEQSKVLKCGRSNCELDATKLVGKLEEYGIEVPEIHVAYRACFSRMKAAGLE